MTGGGLGARFTAIPGSSNAFVGGVIVYSVVAKMALLGISAELLEEHGPVSEPVAIAMAEAVRNRTGATWGVSITGNAGPTSDVDGKPVGLTFVAIAGPNGTTCEQNKYRGIREDIQRRASQTAISMLRWKLLE